MDSMPIFGSLSMKAPLASFSRNSFEVGFKVDGHLESSGESGLHLHILLILEFNEVDIMTRNRIQTFVGREFYGILGDECLNV